jgi:transcriptional regulator with XRE-family HTH domain
MRGTHLVYHGSVSRLPSRMGRIRAAKQAIVNGATIADLLKRLKEAGVEDATIAADMAVNTSTISRWRAGEIIPGPARVPALARLLGLSEAEVIVARHNSEMANLGPAAQTGAEDEATEEPDEDVRRLDARIDGVLTEVRELRALVEQALRRRGRGDSPT